MAAKKLSDYDLTFLSVSEFAKRSDRHMRTIQKAMKAGKIKFTEDKFGKPRISMREFCNFMGLEID